MSHPAPQQSREATGQMIGLENCRSLDVILVPIGEVCTGQLRTVTPRES